MVAFPIFDSLTRSRSRESSSRQLQAGVCKDDQMPKDDHQRQQQVLTISSLLSMFMAASFVAPTKPLTTSTLQHQSGEGTYTDHSVPSGIKGVQGENVSAVGLQ